MAPVCDVPAGVVTGENLVKLFNHAKDNGYAIPAVNVSSSSTANAVMEAAKATNSPVILQVSQGGGQFIGGKGLDDKAHAISAAGSVAIALHIRAVRQLQSGHADIALHLLACMSARPNGTCTVRHSTDALPARMHARMALVARIRAVR